VIQGAVNLRPAVFGLCAAINLSFVVFCPSPTLGEGRGLEEILKEEKSILDALDRTVFEARRAEQAITTAETARSQAEARLAESGRELKAAREKEDFARKRLKDTLRLVAAARPVGTASELLLGMGKGDDGRRRVLLDRLSRRQATELSRLIDAVSAANTADFVASMDKANSHAAAEAGRQARDRLKAETRDRQQLLVALERDRKVHRRHAREMGEAQRDMAKLVRSRLSRAPGAVRFDRLKERVRWPLADATVLVPFGNRIHPEFKTETPHPGLTLSYPRGRNRNVRAVAFGKVVFAGRMRGYGTTVVLDHASGYYTVYGGLPLLRVKEGDIVREGEILGQVERGPGDEDLRLYFELRKGSKALDPLPYLLKREPG